MNNNVYYFYIIVGFITTVININKVLNIDAILQPVFYKGKRLLEAKLYSSGSQIACPGATCMSDFCS